MLRKEFPTLFHKSIARTAQTTDTNDTLDTTAITSSIVLNHESFIGFSFDTIRDRSDRPDHR